MGLQFQKYFFRLAAVSLLVSLSVIVALAQTTSFTYQGRLTDAGTPANGNYDLQFALFDSVSGGTQIGATQPIPNVSVAAGIFTVQLDFGANAFPGANRFLEIGARLTGGGAFTILSPRQQITSTPYAIRSLNASSADAVTVTGVPGGSGNYIQNNPASQQAGNFNISGNGTTGGTLSGNIVNTTAQYNLGGSRILSSGGTNNLFAGKGAGLANITGSHNAFFGFEAGAQNTGDADPANLVGSENAFFGAFAGENSKAGRNSFFGAFAGVGNNIGQSNSFFGWFVGGRGSDGDSNSFFGFGAGGNNFKGGHNAFFGREAGASNSNGSRNTVIGDLANVGSDNLTNATAIGSNAQVDQSNSLVLGSVAGFLVRRLRPIRFTWKNTGTPDLGLGAEDVAKVEPLLVTHNDKGEIQGVKYDQLNVVLINAIKQQQEQIETLRAQNVALNARLRSVERIVRKRAGSARRRY